MKLKIKDIAKKAGVSTTAVSFALNGKAGIDEKNGILPRITLGTGDERSERPGHRPGYRDTGRRRNIDIQKSFHKTGRLRFKLRNAAG